MIPRTCVIVHGKTEISAFFLTFFTLAGVKNLHLDEIGICRCTAHHDGVQDGARVKSIPPTRSDLFSQKKGLILLIMTSASKKILRIKKGT